MLIVRFMGGFANQLYQYALYLRLKEDFPEETVKADINHFKYKNLHGGFKFAGYEDFIYASEKESAGCIKVCEDDYDDCVISENEKYCFDGYWQDEKYFPKDITPIVNIFDTEKLDDNSKAYAKKINGCFSVSIHIRRGDYEHDAILSNVATPCYYQNAIDYELSKNDAVTFFVFSDDINWCRSHLDYHDANVIYVEGNGDKPENDIALMSICRHNIISNSSFSRWASYLNTHEDKLIIMPEYWVNCPCQVRYPVIENAVALPNKPVYDKAFELPMFTFAVYIKDRSVLLRRNLSSLVNQTYDNIEIILADDGSSDAPEKVYEAYMDSDKRISLIRNNSEKGLMLTLSEAVDIAKGKYIIFIDAGDFVNTRAAEILAEETKNPDAHCIGFDYMVKPGNHKVEGDNALLWAKCFDRSKLKDIIEPSEKDAVITNIKHCNEVLCYHMKNASNNTFRSLEEMELNDRWCGSHALEGYLSKAEKYETFSQTSKRHRIKVYLKNAVRLILGGQDELK